MKKLLKISGLVAIVLLFHGNLFSQDEKEGKDKPGKMGDREEIIIKPKNDKDTKITLEIKDGQVFIDGKPVDDFDNDNISIERRKRGESEDVFAYTPNSVFRGGAWNYDGENLMDSKMAFLGVSTDKAEAGGAEVREVTKGSAAENSGLKKGDVIIRIDDLKIDDADDLINAIRKHKPGDKVVVTYKRDDKEQKADVVLGKFKMQMNYNFDISKMNHLNRDFNMATPGIGAYSYSLAPSSPRIGLKAQDTEDGKGVKVLDVDDDSPADKAGIKEGDIITQFDDKQINGVGQLADLARADKTKPSIKVKFTRDGKPKEAEIKIPRKLKTADL